jgi:hypothetical protein
MASQEDSPKHRPLDNPSKQTVAAVMLSALTKRPSPESSHFCARAGAAGCKSVLHSTEILRRWISPVRPPTLARFTQPAKITIKKQGMIGILIDT